MHALSTDARLVLDQMERDRRYEVADLRALMSDASAEHLREVMHELWIHRQVERVASSGWRRVPAPVGMHAVSSGRQARPVRPEELFDHDTFQDFFR